MKIFQVALVASSLVFSALKVLGVLASSPGAHTHDMRLIRWSGEEGSTAHIPTAAFSYLTNGVHVDPASPIMHGVPKAFVDHMARISARSRGNAYLDLTEVGPKTDDPSVREKGGTSFPSPNPTSHPEISAMFANISASGLRSTVEALSTKFTTRYYLSENARAPALWIQSQFVDVVGSENVRLVENSFDQPNGASP